MPLYDYDCSACGRRFEVVHSVHVEGPTVCPICGKGPVHKAITAPAVHFKGTGWAKRDRRATATPGASRASSEDSSRDEGAKGDEGPKRDDGAKRDEGAKRDDRDKADDGAKGEAAGSSAGSRATTATKPAQAAKPAKQD